MSVATLNVVSPPTDRAELVPRYFDTDRSSRRRTTRFIPRRCSPTCSNRSASMASWCRAGSARRPICRTISACASKATAAWPWPESSACPSGPSISGGSCPRRSGSS